MKRNYISNPSNLDMQKATYRNMIKPIFYEDEIWISLDNVISNIQPWYMVSNYGRIYSKQSDAIMKTTIINSGYERVTLRSINNTPIDALVHRLVLAAFCPIDNCENLQVNHKDTIKTNNHLYNLEWVDNSGNMIHAYNNGLRNIGEDHNWATLNEEQVHMICKCFENNMSYKEICNMLGIEYSKRNCGILYHIKYRHNWKHISKDYNF